MLHLISEEVILAEERTTEEEKLHIIEGNIRLSEKEVCELIFVINL